MSAKKNRSKQKNIPEKRPVGLSDEEYEDYLENIRREKQAAEIEAERLRMKQNFRNVRSKFASVPKKVLEKSKVKENKKSNSSYTSEKAHKSIICKADGNIIQPVDDFICKIFSKLSAILCKTADKKYSVFLFILFSFVVMTSNNYICGYNLFDLTPHVGEDMYQFYLCDYSCGFVSRVLIGAIITHFTDSVTIEMMGLITSVANILSVLLGSVLIGMGIRYSLKKRKFICLIISLSALACPFISVWNTAYYGFLDVFLVICFLLAAFSSGKYIRIIIPAVICALALCIHYSFMFQFAPAILCVLFFYVFYDKNKIINITGFTLAATVTAGLFVWFAVFASDHLKCTAEEYDALMLSRFVIPDNIKEMINSYYDLAVSGGNFSSAEKQQLKEMLISKFAVYNEYFDHYIFRIYKEQTANGMAEFFGNQFTYNERLRNIPSMTGYIILGSPYIIYSLINSARRFFASKGTKKLPFLAIFAASLQIIPALMLSADSIRFVTPAVISVLYMNYITEYNLPPVSTKKHRYPGIRRLLPCLLLCVLWIASVVFTRMINAGIFAVN